MCQNNHAGSRRSALYRDARCGAWSRIARGIYVPADTPAADWISWKLSSVVLRRRPALPRPWLFTASRTRSPNRSMSPVRGGSEIALDKSLRRGRLPGGRRSPVNGHLKLPAGGHENCPLVANRTARSWPAVLPTHIMCVALAMNVVT